MTKSPLKLVKVAYRAAEQALPAYSSHFSRKTFTQPQLFACLALKAFLRTDYRGVVTVLQDCPSLGEAIGLRGVPHFTTLQKSEKRLLRSGAASKLLAESIFFGARKKKEDPASGD